MRLVSPRTVGGVVLTAVVAVGCGRTVTVQPPADLGVAEECQVLEEDLPDIFGGERRLSVDPPSPQTAAWGSPAIVWRCGVGVPSTLEPNSQLIEVAETNWFPQELESGIRFTTVDTSPGVELTVPSIYPSPAGLLTQLSTRTGSARPPSSRTGALQPHFSEDRHRG